MKRILFIGLAVLMLLSACEKPTEMLPPGYVVSEDNSYGIYEFTFSEESLSGGTPAGWDFIYTYNGEEIRTGHQIRFPLEIFSFHSMQVKMVERDHPKNTFSATFAVAICHGGFGETEITVTDSHGKNDTIKVTCDVARVDAQ